MSSNVWSPASATQRPLLVGPLCFPVPILAIEPKIADRQERNPAFTFRVLRAAEITDCGFAQA